MQHKCKVTVLDKKLFPELQREYLADPESGACPFYNVGDEFMFERYGGKDDFWTMGKGSQCAEAWDCISRYIYTALQGGSIMHGWTNNDRVMIACCQDGTRPVIFKIERLDYKAVYAEGVKTPEDAEALCARFKKISGVTDAVWDGERGFAEVYMDVDINDYVLSEAVRKAGAFKAVKIE